MKKFARLAKKIHDAKNKIKFVKGELHIISYTIKIFPLHLRSNYSLKLFITIALLDE